MPVKAGVARTVRVGELGKLLRLTFSLAGLNLLWERLINIYDIVN